MITATPVGGDRLAARFDAMPRALAASLAAEAARLGEELRDAVERNLSGAVLQRRSGRLARSIAVSAEPSGGRVAVSLAGDAPYAGVQEYGGTIPPREILPRSARALAFRWQGRLRFFARVELPPVRVPERSFLRSALDEMAPEIRAALTDAAVRAVTT